MYEAYPLQWPPGYRRTPPTARINSRFDQTMNKAQQFLRLEIQRLNGADLIVSSDIPVRKDGGLYSDWMIKKIEDPGVAIYFKHKGKQISMCCDQYARVWENIYALGKGIEALRGMQRWGVSDFLERAFTGFAALPESTTSEKEIWNSLGLSDKPASVDEVHNAYKFYAKKNHPDSTTGSNEKFIALQDAYKKALNFFK